MGLNTPLLSSSLSYLRRPGSSGAQEAGTMFYSAQTAPFQKMTPGCYCFTARSSKHSNGAEEQRHSLCADTSSFLFAVSECLFMEIAFCSTVRETKSSFTREQPRPPQSP